VLIPGDGPGGHNAYTAGSLFLSAAYGIGAELARAAAAPWHNGQWNTLEIIAIGNDLRVVVNKREVVRYTDLKQTYTEGVIKLITRVNSTIKFRKIEIKEFPPAPPPVPRGP
jgi:hypothetical protein